MPGELERLQIVIEADASGVAPAAQAAGNAVEQMGQRTQSAVRAAQQSINAYKRAFTEAQRAARLESQRSAAAAAVEKTNREYAAAYRRLRELSRAVDEYQKKGEGNTARAMAAREREEAQAARLASLEDRGSNQSARLAQIEQAQKIQQELAEMTRQRAAEAQAAALAASQEAGANAAQTAAVQAAAEGNRALAQANKEAAASAQGAGSAAAAQARAAQDTAAAARDATQSVRAMNAEAEASRRGTSIFSSIGRAMRSMLLIRSVTGTMRHFVRWMGQAAMANAQFKAAVDSIRGNLISAFAPIYDAIIPWLTSLANAIANVVGWIARLASFFFPGNHSATASMLSGIGGAAGGAAKQVRGLLAQFDELNTLERENGSGGGGGGGNGSGGGSGSGGGGGSVSTIADTARDIAAQMQSEAGEKAVLAAAGISASGLVAAAVNVGRLIFGKTAVGTALGGIGWGLGAAYAGRNLQLAATTDYVQGLYKDLQDAQGFLGKLDALGNALFGHLTTGLLQAPKDIGTIAYNLTGWDIFKPALAFSPEEGAKEIDAWLDKASERVAQFFDSAWSGVRSLGKGIAENAREFWRNLSGNAGGGRKAQDAARYEREAAERLQDLREQGLRGEMAPYDISGYPSMSVDEYLKTKEPRTGAAGKSLRVGAGEAVSAAKKAETKAANSLRDIWRGLLGTGLEDPLAQYDLITPALETVREQGERTTSSLRAGAGETARSVGGVAEQFALAEQAVAYFGLTGANTWEEMQGYIARMQEEMSTAQERARASEELLRMSLSEPLMEAQEYAAATEAEFARVENRIDGITAAARLMEKEMLDAKARADEEIAKALYLYDAQTGKLEKGGNALNGKRTDYKLADTRASKHDANAAAASAHPQAGTRPLSDIWLDQAKDAVQQNTQRERASVTLEIDGRVLGSVMLNNFTQLSRLNGKEAALTLY